MPNAALVRTADSHQRHRQHQRGANPGGGAGGGAGGAAAGVRYKLVALRDFFAAAPSPQELLIDYSAVPWLAEAPRMGWKCADEAGQPVEYKDVRRRYNTDPSISVREDLLGGFVRPALRASASAVSAIRHLPTPTAGGASSGAGRGGLTQGGAARCVQGKLARAAQVAAALGPRGGAGGHGTRAAGPVPPSRYRLEVRPSKVGGEGVFTLDFIPPYSVILCVPPPAAGPRLTDINSWPAPHPPPVDRCCRIVARD
jgi:hypothetical protein